MKTIIVLLGVLLCSTGFASAKKVEVEFSYTNDAILSANLYMDDVKVCAEMPLDRTRQDFQEYKVLCDSVEIVAGSHRFTLTAMMPGEETEHSPGYPFEIELMTIKDFVIE